MGRIFGVLNFFILFKFVGSSKNLRCIFSINGFIFKNVTWVSMSSFIFYPIGGKKILNQCPCSFTYKSYKQTQGRVLFIWFMIKLLDPKYNLHYIFLWIYNYQNKQQERCFRIFLMGSIVGI